MKRLHPLIISSLLIPFLSLHAEEEAAPFIDQLTAESALFEEAAPLPSLEEELSMLEVEFEEMKEELYSLEEQLEKRDEVALSAILSEPEPILEQMDAPLYDESLVENEVALADKFFITEDGKIEDDSLSFTMMDERMASDSYSTYQSDNSPALASAPARNEVLTVDLKHAFSGSPVIYTILFVMSVFAVCAWFYSLISLSTSTKTRPEVVKSLHSKLNSNSFEEALDLCKDNNSLFCKMVATGIHSRRHGLPIMIEAMKAEGKRASVNAWQRIGMLNDIAIIAPLLGLLGTVLGMFYAFYDINRSVESISSLFDGLGISVGTTVAGLVVAILSLILHSTAKYRLVKTLATVENDAQSLASLIDDRTSLYNKG